MHVGLVRVHERVVASEVSLAPTAAAPGALRMEHALHGVGPNWQAALRVLTAATARGSSGWAPGHAVPVAHSF